MTSADKDTRLKHAWERLKPFAAGAFLALAGSKLLAGGRNAAQRDRFGMATGRGVPGTPPSAAALSEGYEVTDARGRDLAITMGIFAGTIALVIGGAILSLWLFAGTPEQFRHFTQAQSQHIEPPLPHLQAEPVRDLTQFQARENTALTSYGSLGHGLAHIPIARAMALLQGKPLDPGTQVQK